jgi:hypothetical protein
MNGTDGAGACRKGKREDKRQKAKDKRRKTKDKSKKIKVGRKEE